jgi:hypothetical protein
LGTRGPKRKVNPKRVLACIPETGGIIIEIIKKLKEKYDVTISWQTLKRYFNENPELEQARVLEEEIWGDIAESKLLVQIKAGNLNAVNFFLKTKMKRRGYVEKTEVAGVKEEPITIAVFPALAQQSEQKQEQIDLNDTKLLELGNTSMPGNTNETSLSEIIDVESTDTPAEVKSESN